MERVNPLSHIKGIHATDGWVDPMFIYKRPKIRYISLFSGIEAWSCAVKDMPEYEPVAFCEIEEFQSAVLKKHFPNVPNYGDIRKLDGRQFRGVVDLVVGGSPCQDWSCAGKRAGLEGDRSVLALEYIRILEEVHPRWIVFENVPGLLSCNSGADFQLLLQKMDELGYSCSWTILDSQYQFLAQRRRRVFLVGHIGADWLSSAKVLLEPESMCRNPPTRRKAGQEDTGRSQEGARNSGVSGTLCASGAGLDRPSASGNQLDYLVQDVMDSRERERERERVVCDPVCGALCARDYKSVTSTIDGKLVAARLAGKTRSQPSAPTAEKSSG